MRICVCLHMSASKLYISRSVYACLYLHVDERECARVAL